MFDAVCLRGTNYAFESENRAFRVASVPESGTVALPGLGLVGLGLSRRRKVV